MNASNARPLGNRPETMRLEPLCEIDPNIIRTTTSSCGKRHRESSRTRKPTLAVYMDTMKNALDLGLDWLDEREMTSVEADALTAKVTQMAHDGVKLLALDFDETIVATHTSGSWDDTPEALAQLVRPVFQVSATHTSLAQHNSHLAAADISAALNVESHSGESSSVT